MRFDSQHRSGPPSEGGNDRQQQDAAGEGDDVPTLATSSPAEQRGQPDQPTTGDSDMDHPSDAQGAEGLRITTPRPDTVDILVAAACALLETVGELTGREPEAEALVKVVRTEFRS